jgi:hypothetical protein
MTEPVPVACRECDGSRAGPSGGATLFLNPPQSRKDADAHHRCRWSTSRRKLGLAAAARRFPGTTTNFEEQRGADETEGQA